MLTRRGGGGAYVGHLIFLKNFYQTPPWSQKKNGSNQVKSPYPGDKLYRISAHLAVYL